MTVQRLLLVLTILAFGAAHSQAEEHQAPLLQAGSPPPSVKTEKVALVQLASEKVGDWKVIAERVAEAKSRGAEIVVFPESSMLGWLNPKAFSEATVIPGPVTSKLATIAADNRVYIASGLAERGPKISDGIFRPYDAGVLVGPDGSIVLHSRKVNVLRNAFDPAKCPPGSKNPGGGCNYYAATVAMIPVADTPLGKTAIIICADAYTTDTRALDHLKALGATTIIVVWGVTAAQADQCGTDGYNAVGYAAAAAKYANATVIGANAVGNRPYGRFLPSVYCGYSGIVAADGSVIGEAKDQAGVFVYNVPIVSRPPKK